MKIKWHISSETDPYYNLALEDVILREHRFSCEQEVIALFYVNSPCVVLGNFQCLWKEIPLEHLRTNNLDIVRRQSGGGTVYHDLGNLNFVFIFPKDFKRKNYFNEVLQDFFRKKDLRVGTSGRDDLGVIGKDTFYKFSGQAFKQTKDRVLHHGTLLFESNLTLLENLCRPNKDMFESKSVDSVVSKVTNLSNHLPEVLNPKELAQEIKNYLSEEYDSLELSDTDEFSDQIEIKRKELTTWENIFGRTPKFQMKLNILEVELIVFIEKARIKAFQSDESDLVAALSPLIGSPLLADKISSVISEKIKSNDLLVKQTLDKIFKYLIL